MNYSHIRKQIKNLLDEADMHEKFLAYKRAKNLRDRATFLSQALEHEMNLEKNRRKRK